MCGKPGRRRGWQAAVAVSLGLHGAPAAAEPLTVFAAASTTDVVGTLAARFAGARVRTSFGASSELARQIADGAPADVFVSASRAWMDFLRDAGALEGEATVFASNVLVCVAPKRGPLRARDVPDPAALLARGLASGDRVAIADAGVPAGEYTRASLARLGVLDALRPRLVGLKDVRAVLHAVELGEAAAGFVYATDARRAAVEVLFALDPATHPPIELLAGVVRGARNTQAARGFVEYLRGGEARALLLEAGFRVPEGAGEPGGP